MFMKVLYLALVGLSAAYQNSYDGELLFECPSHDQTLNSVQSVHDNSHEDRIFQLECKTIDIDADLFRIPSCSWADNYVNNYNQLVHFECPNNGYITGVHSLHYNSREDRIWNFQCCQMQGVHLTDCDLTGFVNDFEQEFKYVVPTGKAVTGVISVYDNGTKDRRFEFIVCDFEYKNEGEGTVG